MEVSAIDPPKPIIPGLTPTDREEVITIRIQPEVWTPQPKGGGVLTEYVMGYLRASDGIHSEYLMEYFFIV